MNTSKNISTRIEQINKRKILKRLQVRMMLSYVGMSVAFVLLLEILFGTIALLVLSNSEVWDGDKFDTAKQLAQVYALEATVQSGAQGLHPGITFQPGRPASLGLSIENASSTISYRTKTTEQPWTINYALVIDPQGRVVASSCPGVYPLSVTMTQLLPQQTVLIRQALAGRSGSNAYTLTHGRVIVAVQPIWNQQKRVVGAIYIGLPLNFSVSEFLLDLGKGIFGTGLFLLIVLTPVGGFFGLLTMRGLVRRIHRLVVATANFAAGDYSQRVVLTRQDEIGQLELQFNQMAEQLTESIAQEQKLGEQNARLEERASIARDLHDNIKQQIFAVSMQLGAALSLMEQKPEAACQHVVEADNLAYQARQELTLLVRELRPSVLQEKGLSAALKEYVAAWSRQNSIVVELSMPESCNLVRAIEDALLRVTQEALSNIARHSCATEVAVTLACERESVELVIRDNGQGFDPARKNTAGFGLHSMRERMEALGGMFFVESKPGEGTGIVARCVLHPRSSPSDDGKR